MLAAHTREHGGAVREWQGLSKSPRLLYSKSSPLSELLVSSNVGSKQASLYSDKCKINTTENLKKACEIRS